MSSLQWLEEEAERSPIHAAALAKFGELHTQKLWHQLSIELRSFVSAAPVGYDLQPLYAKFIKASEDKLTPLQLAHTVTTIATRNGGASRILCSAICLQRDVALTRLSLPRSTPPLG